MSKNTLLMKQYITLLLCCCLLACLGNLSAQPTLRATTTNPPFGLNAKLYGNLQFNAGSAGPSQNWNFTTQTYTLLGIQRYDSCSAVLPCTSFPGTSVIQLLNDTPIVYFNASSSALSVVGLSISGIVATPLNAPFTNVEDYYKYPLTYNDSFVDSWQAMYVNGIPYYRKGTDSVKADGWGTLKTPAGTFANVLRLKRIQTYKDSAPGITPVVISYKATEYTWHDTAHKDFLYWTMTLNITPPTGSPTTMNYARYTANQMVAVPETNKGALAWTVRPNPAKGKLRIDLPLQQPTDISFTLYDMTGRAVSIIPQRTVAAGSNKLDLDVSSLAPGVYILRMYGPGGLSDAERVLISE